MQPNRSKARRGTRFLDIKILIGTLTVAVVIGLWNLFSNNTFLPDKVAPTADLAVPPQPPAGAAANLPALPTLAPLFDTSTSRAAAVPQPATSGQPVDAAASLRVVGAPTPAIVQKFKPVVVQPGLASQPGGGGGGAPAPAAVTSSSR